MASLTGMRQSVQLETGCLAATLNAITMELLATGEIAFLTDGDVEWTLNGSPITADRARELVEEARARARTDGAPGA